MPGQTVLPLTPVEVPTGYPETAVASLPCLSGESPRRDEAEACAVECDMLGGTVTLRSDPAGAHVCAFGPLGIPPDPSEVFSCALQCVATEPPARVLSEPPLAAVAAVLICCFLVAICWKRLGRRALREARYIQTLEAELLRLRAESLRE